MMSIGGSPWQRFAWNCLVACPLAALAVRVEVFIEAVNWTSLLDEAVSLVAFALLLYPYFVGFMLVVSALASGWTRIVGVRDTDLLMIACSTGLMVVVQFAEPVPGPVGSMLLASLVLGIAMKPILAGDTNRGEPSDGFGEGR